MQNRNKIFVAALVILFILAGFFREFVFVNWNEQIRVTYYHSPDPNVAPSMQWLSGLSYSALYWLKWPLTLCFSLVFAGLAVLIIKLLFSNRSYNLITLYAYAAIFTASFLFFGFGWLIGFRESSYEIARFLAGIIETPAMLIILIASFLVHRRL